MKRQDNQMFEVNCQEIITSEDYIDVVREVTEEELEANIDNPEYACVQLLNERYGVFYINRENLTCDEAYRVVPYQEVPNLYGLYGKRAVAAAGIAEVQNLPALQLTGLDVLIGVVDTGIDYTHEAFIYEDDTTKIVRMWDQTGVGSPPDGFKFGTEFNETQINEALLADDPFSLVPEMDDIGHGTFIAGVAAGREKDSEDFIGAAPDANLVVVKLKPAKQCIKDFYLVREDAIAYQSHDVILGVNYCLDVASQLNRPIVILLGCGDNMGPHDGQTIEERILAEVGMNSGVIVTVPAGNEANLYHHYHGAFRDDEEAQEVQFNVPENETGFYLSFWNKIPDKYTIGLISPRGTTTGQIPFKTNQKQEITFIEERTEILIEYAFVEERTGDQAIFIRLKYPSPGIWTLVVYGDIVLNGTYDIYLPRAGFVDPLTRFLQPDPYTTVTSPATNPATITVGAYNDITSSLYLSSGRGLTRGLDIKPDFVAPGVNVIGPYPRGEYGSMTGTGVATAITAGASALLLQWGIIRNNLPIMDTVIAKTFLIRGAYRRPTIEYPNREWGYGELDLINTFRIIQT